MEARQTNVVLNAFIFFFLFFTARKPLRKYSDASSNDCPVTIQASISIFSEDEFSKIPYCYKNNRVCNHHE